MEKFTGDEINQERSTSQGAMQRNSTLLCIQQLLQGYGFGFIFK
jgi:hypothetical protein